MAVCSESSLSMSCWEVGVLTAVFFLSCLKSCLDRCVLIVWHPLTWITVKSYEPERFTFSGQTPQLHSTPRIRTLWSTLLLLFFFLFASRQPNRWWAASHSHSSPCLCWANLSDKHCSTFPLLSQYVAKLFLRRFGSLKRPCEEAGRTLRNSNTEKKGF